MGKVCGARLANCEGEGVALTHLTIGSNNSGGSWNNPDLGMGAGFELIDKTLIFFS